MMDQNRNKIKNNKQLFKEGYGPQVIYMILFWHFIIKKERDFLLREIIRINLEDQEPQNSRITSISMDLGMLLLKFLDDLTWDLGFDEIFHLLKFSNKWYHSLFMLNCWESCFLIDFVLWFGVSLRCTSLKTLLNN